MTHPAGPPNADDPAALAELRRVLWAARYTSEGVRDALGAESDKLTPPSPHAHAFARTLPRAPLSTLIKLFLFGFEVRAAEASDALGRLGAGGLARLGLVADDDPVVPLVRIVPCRDLLLTCDRALESAASEPDHVTGPSGSSLLLADVVVRRPVSSAVDVGTGSGVLAFLAARHADRVVGTDLNPRAVAFARFNARLNGIGNVEFRQGSLFEPVAGETFDLVLSNPPFVLAPMPGMLFRDAGSPGDAFNRSTVAAAATCLEPDGIAHVLTSWINRGEEWSVPLRDWVAGTGCDAWFMRFGQDDPVAYTVGWNSYHYERDPDLYRRTLDAWMAAFDELGARTIGWGAVLLRKRDGENWFRADDIQPERLADAGDQIWRLVEAEDHLQQVGDRLLDEVYTLAPRHRLEQILRLREGGFVVDDAAVAVEEGLRFRGTIDAFTAHVLARLDGRTLAEALADAARAVGRAGIASDDLRRSALPTVRRMVAMGLLVPAGIGPAEANR